MGTLIPSPGDTDVVRKLDARFSGPRLARLRAFVTGTDNVFQFGRQLHRISHRLNIWPTGAKGRWYYFLRNLLTGAAAAQNFTTVAEAIRHALWVFVHDDPNCTAIKFHVHPDATGSLPVGINYRADINPDPGALPTGPYVASINLVCRTEIPHGVNEADPTTPDPGEQGPDQPNI